MGLQNVIDAIVGKLGSYDKQQDIDYVKIPSIDNQIKIILVAQVFGSCGVATCPLRPSRFSGPLVAAAPRSCGRCDGRLRQPRSGASASASVATIARRPPPRSCWVAPLGCCGAGAWGLGRRAPLGRGRSDGSSAPCVADRRVRRWLRAVWRLPPSRWKLRPLPRLRRAHVWPNVWGLLDGCWTGGAPSS